MSFSGYMLESHAFNMTAPCSLYLNCFLISLTVSSSCNWDANTKEIVAKGNSRLWFLRRLKFLGASSDTLIDIYKLFCRSVLEYGAPVWSGNLKKCNTKDIERVQKNAYKIIFGGTFTSYDDCRETNEEETLEVRRDKLFINFAEACLVFVFEMNHILLLFN